MTTTELPNHPKFEEQRKLFGTDWLYFGTIHHHCETSAFASGTDKENETGIDGIHITIGKLDEEVLDAHCRITIEGVTDDSMSSRIQDFVEIPLDIPTHLVPYVDTKKILLSARQYKDLPFPSEWKENIIEPVEEVVATTPYQSYWDTLQPASERAETKKAIAGQIATVIGDTEDLDEFDDACASYYWSREEMRKALKYVFDNINEKRKSKELILGTALQNKEISPYRNSWEPRISVGMGNILPSIKNYSCSYEKDELLDVELVRYLRGRLKIEAPCNVRTVCEGLLTHRQGFKVFTDLANAILDHCFPPEKSHYASIIRWKYNKFVQTTKKCDFHPLMHPVHDSSIWSIEFFEWLVQDTEKFIDPDGLHRGLALFHFILNGASGSDWDYFFGVPYGTWDVKSAPGTLGFLVSVSMCLNSTSRSEVRQSTVLTNANPVTT